MHWKTNSGNITRKLQTDPNKCHKMQTSLFLSFSYPVFQVATFQKKLPQQNCVRFLSVPLSIYLSSLQYCDVVDFTSLACIILTYLVM
jgi:hypothetical protein